MQVKPDVGNGIALISHLSRRFAGSYAALNRKSTRAQSVNRYQRCSSRIEYGHDCCADHSLRIPPDFWRTWASRRFLRHGLMLILFVANLLHPVDNLSVKLFLNGDVRHGCGWRGPVPVLLTGRKPDHITRADFLDRPALALGPAATGGYDHGLTECCPRARLESYAGAP